MTPIVAYDINGDGDPGQGSVINMDYIRKMYPLIEKVEKLQKYLIVYSNGDREQVFIDPANAAAMLNKLALA